MSAPDLRLSLSDTHSLPDARMQTGFWTVYRQHLERESARIRRVWGLSLLALSVTGVALVWVIAILPPPPPPPLYAPPPAAIAIDLAPEPASVMAPPQPLPPGPAQVAPSVPVIEPPPQVMAPPSPNPLPPVAVPKKIKVQPKRKITPSPPVPPHPMLPAQTQSTAATAPPASDAPPSSVSATTAKGAPSAAPASQTVPSWQSAVLARLERFKRYPAQAQSERQEGTVMLRFTMNREGHVLAASLARKTGYDLLDDETLALIRRAEPLPVPPETIKGATLTLTVPVEFYLNER